MTQGWIQMNKSTSDSVEDQLYSGPERRHANKPRRANSERRHRVRTESLVSDCRENISRRKEDEEGFVEINNLYTSDN